MTLVDSIALGWIAVSLAVITAMLVVVAWAERRDRQAAKLRHPAYPDAPPRRLLATRCAACLMPVRYERHPYGRDDALALHAAYECAGQLARKDSR